MKKSTAISLIFLLFLAACSPAASGGGVSTPIVMTAEVSTVIPDGGGGGPLLTPEPPTPVPTLVGGLPVAELKYRVLEEFPDFFFCDPDNYPVAREDESVLAQQAFPELQADQEEFQAILIHTGLSAGTNFTDEQKLQIYREHKKLNAIFLQLAGDRYQFQIQTGVDGQPGTLITGTVAGDGSIEVSQREPSFPACPICLAKGTWIDTPSGPIRVEDLREGDTVWTQDEAGRRVTAFLVRTGRVRVPATREMIHIILSDGRELWASPGHPTSNGRRLGELSSGEILDGARIVKIERFPYDQAYTYDILPSGKTGYYWANGTLMGSTLASP